MSDREELIAGRRLAHVEFDVDYEEGNVPSARFVDSVDEANLITSRVEGSVTRHKPVIDLDLPARLVPSSTPGHYHLYIDAEVSWEAYARLLKAFVEAGLVEKGYLGASLSRGFSSVRPPWVRK